MKVELEGLVLAVLLNGPLHGYGIVKELRAQTAELLTVGEGLLYPLLHRLEEEGLIVGTWLHPQPGKPPRKTYALTKEGHARLNTRREEWKTMQTIVNQVLLREGV